MNDGSSRENQKVGQGYSCELNRRCVSDEDMTKSKGKDPLEGLGGPMTRARARKAKEALQQVLSILFEYKPMFQGEKSKVVSCIMAQMEED
ncbi:hypothetical protein D0Y65_009743 [Glycine soja]|uniref:Uncharacterized protein n=1 Tax=Glycine soja TaxID=3848 RepID=A0A445L0D4_GLYSO|nr:hypothetical protein D0Y65_009743 [Glycine soja]